MPHPGYKQTFEHTEKIRLANERRRAEALQSKQYVLVTKVKYGPRPRRRLKAVLAVEQERSQIILRQMWKFSGALNAHLPPCEFKNEILEDLKKLNGKLQEFFTQYALVQEEKAE